MTIIFSAKRLSAIEKETLTDAPITHNGNSYRIDLPQLPAKAYTRFKPLLHSLGIYWNGSFHEAFSNPATRIHAVLEAGKHPKANPYSLFETPPAAISDLFLVADFPEPTDYPFTILEPQAGKGAIAPALRERYPKAKIDCCEIDPINQDILKGQGFNVVGADFLIAPIEQRYDLIAMNPPFEGTKWVEHVLKAHALLKDNGILAVIAPAACTRRSDHAALTSLQQLIGKCGYVEPNCTPFEGTKVETVLIKLPGWGRVAEQQLFQPEAGFSSRALYSLMTVLTADGLLYETISKESCLETAIREVENYLYRLMESDCAFYYWNQALLQQAAQLLMEKHEQDNPFPDLPLFNWVAPIAA